MRIETLVKEVWLAVTERREFECPSKTKLKTFLGVSTLLKFRPKERI